MAYASSDSNVPALNLSAADAQRAVALCRAGAVHEGIALYVQVMDADDKRGNSLVPIGLDLKFLEGMGLMDAVASIRRAALKRGRNLCVTRYLHKPADIVAAEYQELFRQGIVNSAMVADYLLQLSKLGETAELMRFLDVDRFVRIVEMSNEDGDRRGGEFWETIAATLLEERADTNWQEEVQAVRRMHFVPLHKHADRHIRRCLVEVRHHVSQYFAEVRAANEIQWPREFEVAPWATISVGDGYAVPHFHHAGVISGILYVAGPNEMGADGYPVGALRVGAPPEVENAAGWPDLAIAPKPGTLVLMPSYFTHWTIPLGTDSSAYADSAVQ